MWKPIFIFFIFHLFDFWASFLFLYIWFLNLLFNLSSYFVFLSSYESPIVTVFTFIPNFFPALCFSFLIFLFFYGYIYNTYVYVWVILNYWNHTCTAWCIWIILRWVVPLRNCKAGPTRARRGPSSYLSVIFHCLQMTMYLQNKVDNGLNLLQESRCSRRVSLKQGRKQSIWKNERMKHMCISH